MGCEPAAPMWCFRMHGVHPQLLAGATVDSLLHEPCCKLFGGCGEISKECVMRQLPVLCAEPDVLDGIWREEDAKGLFIQYES